jgi:hypothetical protein
MSENETILINLIRNHKVPEKAIIAAVEIILFFLSHPELSSSEFSTDFHELSENRRINH